MICYFPSAKPPGDLCKASRASNHQLDSGDQGFHRTVIRKLHFDFRKPSMVQTLQLRDATAPRYVYASHRRTTSLDLVSARVLGEPGHYSMISDR